MTDTTEHRYLVEQLGHSDFGVWDNEDDRWVFEGSRADCEDQADRLNESEERP
jgi:hypothetical protein